MTQPVSFSNDVHLLESTFKKKVNDMNRRTNELLHAQSGDVDSTRRSLISAYDTFQYINYHTSDFLSTIEKNSPSFINMVRKNVLEFHGLLGEMAMEYGTNEHFRELASRISVTIMSVLGKIGKERKGE